MLVDQAGSLLACDACGCSIADCEAWMLRVAAVCFGSAGGPAAGLAPAACCAAAAPQVMPSCIRVQNLDCYEPDQLVCVCALTAARQ
jgi:hypothetical protein